MNGYTDYKSELKKTKQLVDQYDKNLKTIIETFKNVGISNVTCYEDIDRNLALAVANERYSRRKYATGTVYVSANYSEPGSGNAYTYSGKVNMPTFSFTPSIILIDLGFTLFVAAKNKRLNLLDNGDFDGGLKNFSDFFKYTSMTGTITVYEGYCPDEYPAKRYGKSFNATYYAWE